MTSFAAMTTLPRLSKYILHYCIVWSFGGSGASKRALFESLHIRESGLSRRDVIVTVIDSGVATKQPDLVGKLLEGKDASGSPVPSVEDMNGHGTMMTSIIAAGINNGIGIAGIADRVKIRPIRLSASPSETPTDVQIERAWEIANMFKDSDVIVYATLEPFTQRKSVMYKPVITKAVEQGSFVIVSASNNDTATGPSEVDLPCSMANSMPGMVCAAATLTANPTVLLNEAALFASFGVPGTQVLVAKIRNAVGKWGYAEARGSSCATAIVGGIAALMQSFKKLKPDMMKEILLNATEGEVKTAKGEKMRYGVLRPDLAVKGAIQLARHH
ncbi:hypothetical protein FOL47_005714 [Perkinsus chesapeaki]|uniref:subtilisin n=1 Tax=Perkinsus chesapeaki TaxID=330153 RepID=A0A7J6LW09_PERCH|nr:hypothetical protein FOL47_005714 [Perkinsus chesapeaki]